MKRKLVATLGIIAGLTILVAASFWALKTEGRLSYHRPADTSSTTASDVENKKVEPASVTIGKKTLIVSVADTFDSRAQGLSSTDSLPEDTGMFFVFEDSKRWGIWMKDMRYPIDIIWLSASSTIVDAKENATPASYPATFFSKENALYVLEANSGFFKMSSAKIGDHATITLPLKVP